MNKFTYNTNTNGHFVSMTLDGNTAKPIIKEIRDWLNNNLTDSQHDVDYRIIKHDDYKIRLRFELNFKHIADHIAFKLQYGSKFMDEG